MLTKTQAIVLNSTKYGDGKIFVHMFSEEYGIITFLYSISSRSKKNTPINFLQPLNIIEVEFDRKPNITVYKFSTARLVYATATIPFNAYKIAIALFIAEFLRYALANEHENKILYQFIQRSIEWLDTAKENFSNFHIIFMIRFSKFIGFYPYTETFSPGKCFDLREGTFTSLIPLHKNIVHPKDATFIPLLVRLNYTTMRVLKLTREERNICTETILSYYRLHIPDFPELKSFAVVKELFS